MAVFPELASPWHWRSLDGLRRIKQQAYFLRSFAWMTATIELQVGKIGPLFESFDPMPLRERDLERRAEEYIVSWPAELPRRADHPPPHSVPPAGGGRGRDCTAPA